MHVSLLRAVAERRVLMELLEQYMDQEIIQSVLRARLAPGP